MLNQNYLTVIFIMKSSSQEDYDQRINLFLTSFNIIACQTNIVSFWWFYKDTWLERNGYKIVLFHPNCPSRTGKALTNIDIEFGISEDL